MDQPPGRPSEIPPDSGQRHRLWVLVAVVLTLCGIAGSIQAAISTGPHRERQRIHHRRPDSVQPSSTRGPVLWMPCP
jgi:hypothetical protein